MTATTDTPRTLEALVAKLLEYTPAERAAAIVRTMPSESTPLKGHTRIIIRVDHPKPAAAGKKRSTKKRPAAVDVAGDPMGLRPANRREAG